MLANLIMEQYKKAYKPRKGCYVLSYYDKKFDSFFSEEKAFQIALAAEKVVDEILDMLDGDTLTEEIIEEFEAEVHERHQDNDIYKNSKFSSEEIDTIFFITDAFYNGGPFQMVAFEEATVLLGRANGDDTNSIDWKMNLQTLFYSTVYTVMKISLTLPPEEVPEACGWQFFCNCIYFMSDASGGQRYHIKIVDEETIDSIDAFRDELMKYVLQDDAWLLGEKQLSIDDEDRLVISLPYRNSTAHLRFPIDELFAQYQSGGWNTVHKTISQSMDPIWSMEPEKVVEALMAFETAQPHLILRPVNYHDHRQSLVNHIYRRVGDIALVLYFVVSDTVGQLYTTKVTAEVFHRWGMEKETVLDQALLNNITQAQPRIYTNLNKIEDAPFTEGAFMAIDSPVKSLPSRGALLTTTRRTNGAIAAFYPNVKEKIADLFRDDFYAVFTATSELWVHSASSVSPRSLLQTLKSNNKRFQDTMLSRKIYLYRRSEGEFKQLEL